jgi:rhamnose utilization protein RhaD (predicted bifunctional aldolase and dehydrogenase)
MSLRARIEKLIHSTGWPDDKQEQWLKKHGITTWGEASPEVLLKAIEKLEFADNAFPSKAGDQGQKKKSH